MSGIFAVLHRDKQSVNRELLQRMTDSLTYLGPDRQEIWLDDYVGLGHTLFRTTDESRNEQQPCTLNGKVYITANARIDARNELIPQLRKQGCQVSDDAPDVELILHAYQVWGEDCLQYLSGDFAFILWDSNRQQLFCAKDRLGLRQLYYAQVGNALVLCNSLDCLRKYPGVTAKLNEQAVGDFLLFGNYTWLDKSVTIFADIQKIPPAHFLLCQDENLTIKRYWDVPLEVPLLRYKKEADYIAHFHEIFTNAVKDRMRTDKIVISMSGGMDSTSVAATACRIATEMSNPPQIQAFTVVYDRIHPDQERYYSGLVAEKLGLPIHYFVGDDYQMLNPFVKTPEPTLDFFPAMRRVQKRTQATLGRVSLTGIIADNLLSPSPVKTAFREMNPFRVLLQLLRLQRQFGKKLSLGSRIINKIKNRILSDPSNSTSRYPYWFNPEFEAKLQLADRWQSLSAWDPSPINPRHPEAHKWLVFPDWSYGMDYASEIGFTESEIRDPFMDLRVIEFALSLPLVPWFFEKYLLRQAMKAELPPEVISRPKTTFGYINESLLRQPGNEWVDSWQPVPELLLYINHSAIPAMASGALHPHESWINFRPLMFNLWLSQYNS